MTTDPRNVSPGTAGPWGLVPAREVRVVSGHGPVASTTIVLELTTEFPNGTQLIDDNTGTADTAAVGDVVAGVGAVVDGAAVDVVAGAEA